MNLIQFPLKYPNDATFNTAISTLIIMIIIMRPRALKYVKRPRRVWYRAPPLHVQLAAWKMKFPQRSREERTRTCEIHRCSAPRNIDAAHISPAGHVRGARRRIKTLIKPAPHRNEHKPSCYQRASPELFNFKSFLLLVVVVVSRVSRQLASYFFLHVKVHNCVLDL